MGKLQGKVAVITGGATGIGRAAAKRFIEEGAIVFIFGRRQAELDAAVADLGPNARAVKGSVSDLADLDRLYAEVKAERGTLDIVFANAGAGTPLPLGKITAEHIDETFDTNVKGTIFTVQKALPLMGQGGSIILTGSSAGTTGAPAFSVYSASKAAVRNLARTWAEDLKGTGIRVNVLSPGPTATELAKAALGEEGQKVYASMTPLQRMADPAEIGAAAAFLASDDSSFMTASELAVDGELAGGHEAAVVRREKGSSRPDLRRIGHALERSHRGVDFLALLAQRCLREFGRRRPGRQHVYPDAGALQVLRPGPRQVAHCRLARAVDAKCRGARGAGTRSGQDDRAALAHQRQRLLDREDRTLHIGVEGFVNVLGGDLAERKRGSRPGIGEDDVEGSALGLHLCVESVEVGQIGDRALHCAGVGPEIGTLDI